jgi:tetratricopeptide (TPR) repeat protein
MGKGISHHARGDRVDAESEYRLALQELDAHSRIAAPVADWQTTFARTSTNLALLLGDTGRGDEAIDLFRRVIALEPIAKVDAVSTGMLRDARRDAHHGLAQLLDRLGRHDEAIPEWDAAIALYANTPMENNLKLARIGSLARAGDHETAQKQLSAFLVLRVLPPAVMYDVACVQALCAAAIAKDPQLTADLRAERSEALALQSVKSLCRASDLGFFQNAEQRAHFQIDSDLDFLRTRNDFQSLAREVENLDPATSTDKTQARP